MESLPPIEDLWSEFGFTPTIAQERAIRHTDGPLYLPAGPGSGKTRVLLWRVVNLVAYEGVELSEIFLATFTEKAALQLRVGLGQLFGAITNRSGRAFDLSDMYVGTVHSLCQRMLADRRLYDSRQPTRVPRLLDDLAQFFFVYRSRYWNELCNQVGLQPPTSLAVNLSFSLNLHSKQLAVSNVLQLFNRLSEERVDIKSAARREKDSTKRALLKMYGGYCESLATQGGLEQTDFALLQGRAVDLVAANQNARNAFRHVIVDEYQDTNAVQEELFLALAGAHKNLCVVGDDDQALYRFRGATVENFVQFPDRCAGALGTPPETVALSTNFRSRKQIVDFYSRFMSGGDWRGPGGRSFRVEKDIEADSDDAGVSVVASTAAAPEAVSVEVAELIRDLLSTGVVEDPNQVAVLFPSMKYRGEMTAPVRRMKEALEAVGLSVYAPRAGRFLDVPEARIVFGLMLHVFGRSERGQWGGDYQRFSIWLDAVHREAQALLDADRALRAFVEDRQREIAQAGRDAQLLDEAIRARGWEGSDAYVPHRMRNELLQIQGLSRNARQALGSGYFERIVANRAASEHPITLTYAVRRASSLDYNVLDLMYRMTAFSPFREMFAAAEDGTDEGPAANLALVSQYLSRFVDERIGVITGELLRTEIFRRVLFESYLYTLFLRGEGEYEDAEDPFPRGRVPFLTIHQAKGLEFPVVVLGNLRKDDRGPQHVETMVRPYLARDGEPLDRVTEFDTMRMFYVALSRAQKLLVLAHFRGRGQRIHPAFARVLGTQVTRIPDLDVASIPAAPISIDTMPRTYSYTADYLQYEKCHRQYMAFRRLGFVPSRSQTMMFGTLVHRTLDDLHQLLIARRAP